MTVDPAKQQLDEAEEQQPEDHAPDHEPARDPEGQQVDRLAAAEAEAQQHLDDLKRLAAALEREGLTEIPIEGKFDPHVHEALLSQPSDQDEGTVIQVLQKGYSLGDRVLRPARVVIAAPKENGGDAGS